MDKYNKEREEAYFSYLHFIILGNFNSYYYNIAIKGLACYIYYKKLFYTYIPIFNSLINAALEFFKLYRNA